MCLISLPSVSQLWVARPAGSRTRTHRKPCLRGSESGALSSSSSGLLQNQVSLADHPPPALLAGPFRPLFLLGVQGLSPRHSL